MMFGSHSMFAIECDITHIVSDRWIYGHFCFWIDDLAIGDWDDEADIYGIYSWMKYFIVQEKNRFEPTLETSSSEELWHILYNSVMIDNEEGEDILPIFENIRGRFHIAHLGMSAFNNIGMILFESPIEQRILWRHIQGPLYERRLPPYELQHIGKIFCEWFESAFPNSILKKDG